MLIKELRLKGGNLLWRENRSYLQVRRCFTQVKISECLQLQLISLLSSSLFSITSKHQSTKFHPLRISFCALVHLYRFTCIPSISGHLAWKYDSSVAKLKLSTCKWLFSTKTFEFFHNSHLIRQSQQNKLQKIQTLDQLLNPDHLLAVSHYNHYTRMSSAVVLGCNWILFIHERSCPIRLIGQKSLHFEKKTRLSILWQKYKKNSLDPTESQLRLVSRPKRIVFSITVIAVFKFWARLTDFTGFWIGKFHTNQFSFTRFVKRILPTVTVLCTTDTSMKGCLFAS